MYQMDWENWREVVEKCGFQEVDMDEVKPSTFQWNRMRITMTYTSSGKYRAILSHGPKRQYLENAFGATEDEAFSALLNRRFGALEVSKVIGACMMSVQSRAMMAKLAEGLRSAARNTIEFTINPTQD